MSASNLPGSLNDCAKIADPALCPSANSPTGRHHFGRYVRGVPVSNERAGISCKFCGVAPDVDAGEAMDGALLAVNTQAEAPMPDSAHRRAREPFETEVSRKQASSVAAEMSGRECWAVKRRVIGGGKICVLHVDQGEGQRSLIVNGSDWWAVLRSLRAWLREHGKLVEGET